MLKYEEATMELVQLGEDDIITDVSTNNGPGNGSGDDGWTTWPPTAP